MAEIMEQDVTPEVLAEKLNVDADDIRAAGFSTEQMTTMFNQASGGEWYTRIRERAYWSSVALIVTGVVTGAVLGEHNVSMAVCLSAIPLLATSTWARGQDMRGQLQAEVQDTSHQNLLQAYKAGKLEIGGP